jgi:hypothetical protein
MLEVHIAFTDRQKECLCDALEKVKFVERYLRDARIISSGQRRTIAHAQDAIQKLEEIVGEFEPPQEAPQPLVCKRALEV